MRICQQITYFPTLEQNASPEAHNVRQPHWNSVRMGTVTASKTTSFVVCACRKKGCVLNHTSAPPDSIITSRVNILQGIQLKTIVPMKQFPEQC